MKKIISIVLVLFLIVSCIGCGAGKAKGKNSSGSDEPIDISEKTSEQYVLVTEQIAYVEKLIREKAACIAIAPVDAAALEPVLKKAIDAKICVCSFDAPATPDGRMLDISECEGGQMSELLLNEILDISEGEGSFAVVSSFITSSNQKNWICKSHDPKLSTPNFQL